MAELVGDEKDLSKYLGQFLQTGEKMLFMSDNAVYAVHGTSSKGFTIGPTTDKLAVTDKRIFIARSMGLKVMMVSVGKQPPAIIFEGIYDKRFAEWRINEQKKFIQETKDRLKQQGGLKSIGEFYKNAYMPNPEKVAEATDRMGGTSVIVYKAEVKKGLLGLGLSGDKLELTGRWINTQSMAAKKFGGLLKKVGMLENKYDIQITKPLLQIGGKSQAQQYYEPILELIGGKAEAMKQYLDELEEEALPNKK
jgi:hypothetical protein